MPTTITAVVLAVVAAMTVSTVVQLARSSTSRQNYKSTLQAVRWLMVPTGIADLVVVFLVLGALMVASPVLRFGWWHLLGGAGNELLGQTNYSGVWWRVAKFALPLALLLVIPILAHGEEVAFRLGVESKSLLNRVRRLVVFGLMHPLTAGIPLAAGLALIISGAYFERVYLVAIRRLEPEIEAAGQLPSFERLPHPDPPDGPDYDPVAFARYRQAAKAVSEENQRRLNAWRDELPMQAEAAAQRFSEIRMRAVASAAAAHAVSNTLLLMVFIAWIVFTAIYR